MSSLSEFTQLFELLFLPKAANRRFQCPADAGEGRTIAQCVNNHPLCWREERLFVFHAWAASSPRVGSKMHITFCFMYQYKDKHIIVKRVYSMIIGYKLYYFKGYEEKLNMRK